MLKITPPRANRHLYQDFVLKLHNNLITVYDIRQILDQVAAYDDWAFIIPRRLVSSVKDKYILEEMPLDAFSTDRQAQTAAAIYRSNDAVMIKRDRSISQ